MTATLATIDADVIGLTEALASMLATALGEGPALTGSCLFASAVLAHTLADRGVGVVATRGSFRGEDHWWVECGRLRLDPTRAQFDDGPTVTLTHGPPMLIPVLWQADPYPVATDGFYHGEEDFPPAWTREQVLAEAEQAFAVRGEGSALAADLLDELAVL